MKKYVLFSVASALIWVSVQTFSAYSDYSACTEKLKDEIARYDAEKEQAVSEALQQYKRYQHYTGEDLIIKRPKHTLQQNKQSDDGKKPDWFLSNLYGTVPDDINEMRLAGDYISGFEIIDSDAYWNLPEVRKAFTAKSGQLRKDLFDQYYQIQKQRYMLNTGEPIGKFEIQIGHFEGTYANAYAQKIGVDGPDTYTVKTKPDPWGRSYLPSTGWTKGTTDQQCKTDNLILLLFRN